MEDATAWIGRHVELAGPLELTAAHTKPWSVVARVPAGHHTLWFKELGSALAYEPALTEALARQLPRCMPEVVAAEGPRMLTRDAGRQLAKLRPRDPQTLMRAWEEVVVQYAELQIELTNVAGLAAPDFSPELLAQRLGEPVVQLVMELGDTIPLSLVHHALHRNNICLRNGDPVFLDWAQSAIGHPFFGLVKPLRGLVERLGAEPDGPEVLRMRDAYLEPWSTFAPQPQLRAIFAAAYPLGILFRMTAREHVLDSLSMSMRELYKPNTERLTRFAQTLSAPAKLGARS